MQHKKYVLFFIFSKTKVCKEENSRYQVGTQKILIAVSVQIFPLIIFSDSRDPNT